jgi:hypothetical protein
MMQPLADYVGGLRGRTAQREGKFGGEGGTSRELADINHLWTPYQARGRTSRLGHATQ